MNGFAQQPTTPSQGDNQMKKAPGAWTEAEFDRALAIVKASKQFDAKVVANQTVRFLKAAQANNRQDIKTWEDFSNGERAALVFLSKKTEEASKPKGFVPLTDEEYYAQLKGTTLEHGLHPEDDVEIKKIVDSM